MKKHFNILFFSLIFSSSFSNAHSLSTSRLKKIALVASVPAALLVGWITHAFFFQKSAFKSNSKVTESSFLRGGGTFYGDFKNCFKCNDPKRCGDIILADKSGKLYVYVPDDAAPSALEDVKVMKNDYVKFCIKSIREIQSCFSPSSAAYQVIGAQLNDIKEFKTTNKGVIDLFSSLDKKYLKR